MTIFRPNTDRTRAPADWSGAHRWNIRIYYEDTDAGGVVFYANYLKFMERARTEWLRSLGVNQQELSATQGLIFIVSELSIEYKSPAMLDDEVSVLSLVTQIGRASMHFFQRVIRQDRILAQGQIRVGCVNRETLRPAAIPADIHQLINVSSTSLR